MNYIEIPPPNDISSYIKCIWKYHNDKDSVQYTILPNGYFELFMIFEQQKIISVFLSGLRTKPFDVYIPKGVIISAIRFKLSAAEYILNREIASILNTTAQLDNDFWNLNILESLSFEERIQRIFLKLVEITQTRKVDSKKMLLLEMVYIPGLTVKEISNKMLWDRRKINRYFNTQFGLSLKTFLEIVRLRSSFETLKEGILYPDLNYYDQSHYIKEVKKYTNEPPKELSKNTDDRFLQLLVKKES